MVKINHFLHVLLGNVLYLASKTGESQVRRQGAPTKTKNFFYISNCPKVLLIYKALSGLELEAPKNLLIKKIKVNPDTHCMIDPYLNLKPFCIYVSTFHCWFCRIQQFYFVHLNAHGMEKFHNIFSISL